MASDRGPERAPDLPSGLAGFDRLADEELVMFLERDQLVADKSRPIPRAPLSQRASAALWALRLFVLGIGVMVVYTFVAQLAG